MQIEPDMLHSQVSLDQNNPLCSQHSLSQVGVLMHTLYLCIMYVQTDVLCIASSTRMQQILQYIG